MGCSMGTVKSRLSRARNILKKNCAKGTIAVKLSSKKAGRKAL